MHESAACFHNLEWPPAGARLAGPVVWLRGWIVGKPGHAFVDVRVRHGGGTHLGVLGLPRTDLAAHFQPDRPWLPAEFILGVPVPEGPVTLTLEAQDDHNTWHALSSIALTVAADGQPPPRVEGRLETGPDGAWTVRDAHHPFHGHLDAPGAHPELRLGRAPVFGWLLDETRPLAAVLATTDTLVFNHLEHSRTDDALAARVRHPGARHARLRGAVDLPAALADPACLRVYAISPDGAAHLCFAQRLRPAARAATAATPPVTLNKPAPRLLAALPSGRPRRLLLVVRGLWPNDETLRALDLARFLVGSHRWAARVIATEDGPLRRGFEAAGVEALVVDPAPLFAAPDESAVARALAGLERQIWWTHLDAVAVFDPVCGWAITLARRRGLPVLFDCGALEPLAPDPTASAAVQAALRAGWNAATLVCFASATAASTQATLAHSSPATVIGPWHTPGLASGPAAGGRIVVAPLRTAAWLRQHHPDSAARWTFRQGPAGGIDDERLAQRDDAAPAGGLVHAGDWSVADVALSLGPLFGRGPIRAVLDAAATGIVTVAPDLPVVRELFAGTRVPLADPANPLALAHALLAWEAAPDAFQREAAAAAPRLRTAHDPARLLPRWEELLATVAATRG